MIEQLKQEIKKIEYECSNPRNDGYVKALYEQKLKLLKKELKQLMDSNK